MQPQQGPGRRGGNAPSRGVLYREGVAVHHRELPIRPLHPRRGGAVLTGERVSVRPRADPVWCVPGEPCDSRGGVGCVSAFQERGVRSRWG